ncbi:hypothetical protein [Skermanella pratensis]|uniref:hypothetical protein n=1 Tax=Skermanella pratensis TaxID=2233999 RepID=UPI0013018E90|nr:hypothetical protein [Skermanella pratensis]
MTQEDRFQQYSPGRPVSRDVFADQTDAEEILEPRGIDPLVDGVPLGKQPDRPALAHEVQQLAGELSLGHLIRPAALVQGADETVGVVQRAGKLQRRYGRV